MKKILIAVLFLVMTVSGAALAQGKPPGTYMTVGTVDAIFPEDNRIVIGDIPYQLSDAVVIHTTSARNVSAARLRVGVTVGIRFGQGEPIRELWILPRNYKDPRRS